MPKDVMPALRRMKTKIVLLGEGGVGKTSLIRRFVFNEYTDTYLHTIGTKVSKIELSVPYGSNLEIQMDMSIFDVLGQRGFQDLIRETYFHGAQALMAVCDCSRLDSLSALDDWIPPALEVAGDVPVYILVNKIDLGDRRVVTEEQIRKIAEPFAASYVFTSAKTGEFVEDAFNAAAVEVVDRAIRQEQALRVERGLREKLLLLLAKRGTMGLKKAQLSEILRGLSYDELERELSRLEAQGLVAILWHGSAEFTAAITPKGVEESKRLATTLDEE